MNKRTFLKASLAATSTSLLAAEGAGVDYYELRQYSLVSHSKDESPDSAGRVHRVIQLITRQRLTDDQRQSTLFAILVAVNNYTPTESYDVRTWPILDSLRPHLTALTSADPEIFHTDLNHVYITDALVRQCQTEGQLAAVIAKHHDLAIRCACLAHQAACVGNLVGYVAVKIDTGHGRRSFG